VNIGELAVEWRQRGRGDEKGRDQPRQIMHSAEVAADGRQRTRQDRLIDRPKKNRQHHADSNEPLVPVPEPVQIDANVSRLVAGLIARDLCSPEERVVLRRPSGPAQWRFRYALRRSWTDHSSRKPAAIPAERN